VFDSSALQISTDLKVSPRAKWEIERNILRESKIYNEVKKVGCNPILLDLSAAGAAIMAGEFHSPIKIPCDDFYLRGEASQEFIFQARRIVQNVQDTRVKFESFLRSIGIEEDHPSFSTVMSLCFRPIAEARNQIPNHFGSRGCLAWPDKTYAEVHQETGENIICYLQRYLGELILEGIATRKAIREHDKSADTAIDNYIRRRGPLPAYISPKTKAKLVDLELSTRPQMAKETARLRQARYRRNKKKLETAQPG